MARLDSEDWARIRALVEDGKIPVGSTAHLGIIQYELNARNLSRRDRLIIKMSISHSDGDIAKRFGLSRQRVQAIISHFFDGGV